MLSDSSFRQTLRQFGIEVPSTLVVPLTESASDSVRPGQLRQVSTWGPWVSVGATILTGVLALLTLATARSRGKALAALGVSALLVGAAGWAGLEVARRYVNNALDRTAGDIRQVADAMVNHAEGSMHQWLNLTLAVGGAEKKLHFEMVNHPKLTPLLMGLTVFNGLTQNSLYGEGTTLHLSGEVVLHGHAPVQIENTFAPGDSFSPDGLPIALNIQSVFMRLFTNTREAPVFDRIALRVESVPGRQSFSIESAWLEKGEAAPGETLRVRVLLRPYRGAARVEETTVHVPDQATRGTALRVLVTDGETLNRASRGFSFGGAAGDHQQQKADDEREQFPGHDHPHFAVNCADRLQNLTTIPPEVPAISV